MSRIKRLGIIVLSGIISLGSLAGCGSGNKFSTSQDSTESIGVGESYDTGTTTSESYGISELPELETDIGYNRKIIKTGELTLQTETFNASIEAMTREIQGLGGYIEVSNVEGNNFYDRQSRLRSAYYQVRIPTDQFDSFINRSSQYGLVARLNCQTEDVTSAYVDTELRIKTLQTRYDRLLELMEQSAKLADLFQVEQEIANVTYEMERYKGELNQYDALVDMATLTIYIDEVKEETLPRAEPDSFMGLLRETFIESTQGVILGLQQLIVLVTGLIPVAIVLIPIGLLVWVIIKKRKHKRRSKKDSFSQNKALEIRDEDVAEDKKVEDDGIK